MIWHLLTELGRSIWYESCLIYKEYTQELSQLFFPSYCDKNTLIKAAYRRKHLSSSQFQVAIHHFGKARQQKSSSENHPSSTGKNWEQWINPCLLVLTLPPPPLYNPGSPAHAGNGTAHSVPRLLTSMNIVNQIIPQACSSQAFHCWDFLQGNSRLCPFDNLI